jgi:O-antigen ligase
VLLLTFDKLWSLFYNWIASDSNGLGRFRIFASYPETFWKSPVFGLGPGVHGLNGTIEFHNTYLEVLAMSGMAGGIVFVLFTLNAWKEVRWSPFTLGMFVTLYVFGLAGFGMRRLVFWIILSIICVYGKRQRRNRVAERT